MGKDWDKAVPSVEIWKECLRIMKPGSFAFVMSAPRQDVLSQMIVRLTDAGFNTNFTSLYWTYASGFPKAKNVGKHLDKKNGTERIKVGEQLRKGRQPIYQNGIIEEIINDVTIGNSPLEGSYAGFQPKPAVEVIIVAMKPLSKSTYIEQALENNKGITWMDDCRIPYVSERDKKDMVGRTDNYKNGGFLPVEYRKQTPRYKASDVTGRFPANLLVSDKVLNKQKKSDETFNKFFEVEEESDDNDTKDYSRFFDLDTWSDQLPFLVVPKASPSEKNFGCEDMEEKRSSNYGNGGYSSANPTFAVNNNSHPTVKPLKLMAYLITLGSREGDTVLDPFAGSGTTLLAAKHLQRNYIGCELSEEYCKIIEARLGNEA